MSKKYLTLTKLYSCRENFINGCLLTLFDFLIDFHVAMKIVESLHVPIVRHPFGKMKIILISVEFDKVSILCVQKRSVNNAFSYSIFA